MSAVKDLSMVGSDTNTSTQSDPERGRGGAPCIRDAAQVDVKALRQRLGMTQAEFAQRYCFALGSIRNWEQGCRRSQGPARLLLRLIERSPEAVEQALAYDRGLIRRKQ